MIAVEAYSIMYWFAGVPRVMSNVAKCFLGNLKTMCLASIYQLGQILVAEFSPESVIY